MNKELKEVIYISLITIAVFLSLLFLSLLVKQLSDEKCYPNYDVNIDNDKIEKAQYKVGSYYFIDQEDNYIHLADFGAKGIDMVLRENDCSCTTDIDWNGEFKWWYKGSEDDGRCYEWRKRLDCKCYIKGDEEIINSEWKITATQGADVIGEVVIPYGNFNTTFIENNISYSVVCKAGDCKIYEGVDD